MVSNIVGIRERTSLFALVELGMLPKNKKSNRTKSSRIRYPVKERVILGRGMTKHTADKYFHTAYSK